MIEPQQSQPSESTVADSRRRALASWLPLLVLSVLLLLSSGLTPPAGTVASNVAGREAPPPSADGRRAVADSARAEFADGDRLEAEGTPESRRQAIEIWTAARRSFAEADNPGEEARTLNRIGLAHRRLGNLERALAFYAEALPLWQRAGDRSGEATTLHQIGAARERRGDFAGAEAAFRTALELRRATGEPEGIAATQNYLGILAIHFGRIDEALSRLEEALSIRRRVRDRRGQAVPLLNIGAIYNDRGLVDRAESYFRQGLELARELSDARAEAAALNNLAVSRVRAGDLQGALDHYQAAQKLNRASGDHKVVATGYDNLGRLYERLGNRERALEYYEQTLRLARQIGNRMIEAKASNRLGRHALEGGEPDLARRQFEVALDLSRTIGERAIEATAFDGLGECHTAVGDPQSALPLHRQALGVWQQLRRPYEQAEALDHLGTAHLALGDHRQAEVRFRQALVLDRAIGNPNGEALRMRRIAGLLQDRGELLQAQAIMSDALDIVESVRSRLVSLDLRAGFVDRQAEHYDFYIGLLMELARREPEAAYQAVAFAVSERSRARSLLEALGTNRRQIRRGVRAALLEREGELRRQINGLVWYRSRNQASASSAGVARPSWELEQLFTRYETLEAEIWDESTAYAALTRADSLSADEIQRQVLDHDTLLLHYHLAEQRSFLWLITPDSLRAFTLPSRRVLEAQAREVYRLLTARSRTVAGESIEARHRRLDRADAEYWIAADALARALLGPVSAGLDRQRLLIVADGTLHYLPFAALPKPGAGAAASSAPPTATPPEPAEPLMASHEVIHLPSASVLATIRKGSRGTAKSKTLAVFADPVFERQDPRVRVERRGPRRPATASEPVLTTLRDVGMARFGRLRHSRAEAADITGLVPPSEALQALDFEASRSAVLASGLGQYRYLHFATHALLDTRQPQLSGIVLSLVDEEGNPQDGFLGLNDIFDLELQAELVVLSACRTALGREVRGEGLIGVTRGFMHAGARGVLASLWQVDDGTTAALMKRFYRGVLERDLTPAVSLQQAQASMRREGKSPYSWAGFILQGEWR